jgi:hypothetical protein
MQGKEGSSSRISRPLPTVFVKINLKNMQAIVEGNQANVILPKQEHCT